MSFAPTDEHEVAHGNGSRVFHHFSNLRWAIPVENHADRRVHSTDAKGEQNGRAVLTEDDVIAIRKERRDGELNGKRVREWAKKFGLSLSAIYNASRGKTWSHVK